MNYVSALPRNYTRSHRRAMNLAGVVAFLIVYCVVLYGGFVEGAAAEWWTNMAWSIASLAVAVRCIATARAETSSPQRTAWWLFGLGALAWFAGMVWWDYRYLIAQAEFVYPYFYDLLFMAFPLFMVAGTFFYRAQRLSRPLSLIQLANLGVILCTVTICVVVVLYEPIRQAKQSGFFIWFAIFHAVLHLVATVFAIYCYRFYVWKASRAMFLLILASLALHSVADVLYTFELLGRSFDAFNYLNVYWLCAFAFQYIAAFDQRELNRSGLLGESEDDDEPATNTVEALTPALCIVALYLVAFLYQDRLSASVFNITAAAGILFALFLAVRAWWGRQYQDGLRVQLHQANRDLETRVRERTAELEAAQSTLLRQERLAALGQLTASVSHELRNPLGALRNSITLIGNLSGRDNDKIGSSLERANRSITRCDRIIEELLDFSRAHEIKAERGDFGGLLEQTLDDYVAAPGVMVKLEAAPDLYANFDYDRVRRVIINLLDNACEALASDESGYATVIVRCTAIGHEIELVVSDNGPGMTSDVLERVFEPLFSTKGFGVGLGMAIVKQVVELHGGRVEVSSRESRGTRVVINLPIGVAAPMT